MRGSVLCKKLDIITASIHVYLKYLQIARRRTVVVHGLLEPCGAHCSPWRCTTCKSATRPAMSEPDGWEIKEHGKIEMRIGGLACDVMVCDAGFGVAGLLIVIKLSQGERTGGR